MIVDHIVDDRERDHVRAPLTDEEARENRLIWLCCIGFFSMVFGLPYLVYKIDTALHPKMEMIESSNEQIQTQSLTKNEGGGSSPDPIIYVAVFLGAALMSCLFIMMKRFQGLNQERPIADKPGSGSVFQSMTLPREDKINAKSNRFFRLEP